MTKGAITRVLNKVDNIAELSNSDSLGFNRLLCLPNRVKKAYDLKANLETNWDGSQALRNQISFLEDLTKGEFINWLKLA